MIAGVMAGAFVLACVVWGATWIVQLGAILLHACLVVLIAVGRVILTLLGAIAWGVWFLINHRAALEGLRRARSEP